MKIKVSVELGPHENALARDIDAELRQAIGPQGEVSIQPGPAPWGPALDIIRAPNPVAKAEQLIASGAADIDVVAQGISEIAAGAHDDESSVAACHMIHTCEPVMRQTFVATLVSTLSAILANKATSRTAARRASLAMASLITWESLSLVNAVRSACVLLRVPETAATGAILAATLAGRFNAGLKELTDVAELRRALQSATNVPNYEYTFITDSLGWSSPVDTTSVKRLSSRPVGEHVGVMGMGLSLAGNFLVSAAQDGVIQTYDLAGHNVFDTIRLAPGRLPTAIDLSARPRQVFVASVQPGRATINVFAETNATWQERLAVERPGKVITGLRSLRTGPFIAAECGPSDGLVTMFDPVRGTPTQSYSCHTDVITTLHVPSTKDHIFFSTSRDRTVALYDIRVPQGKIGHLASHSGTVSSISTEGDVVVVGGFDGKLTVSDIRTLSAPLGRRVFESAVLRVAQGPNHVCAVSCQTSLQLMSLHVAEMPTARVETVASGRLPCSDIVWIPNRPAFFGLFDGNLDLLQFSPA